MFDIEKQICDQLNARPATNVDWPKAPARMRIVDALAGAVKHEKEHPLEHVTLHPDDPFVLLLWGCYDDLTPVIFRWNLEEAFDLKVSDKRWRELISSNDWFANELTVAEAVEQLLELLLN